MYPLPLDAGLTEDPLLCSAAGVAQEPEDGADPPFGLDAELKPERTPFLRTCTP